MEIRFNITSAGAPRQTDTPLSAHDVIHEGEHNCQLSVSNTYIVQKASRLVRRIAVSMHHERQEHACIIPHGHRINIALRIPDPPINQWHWHRHAVKTRCGLITQRHNVALLKPVDLSEPNFSTPVNAFLTHSIQKIGFHYPLI